MRKNIIFIILGARRNQKGTRRKEILLLLFQVQEGTRRKQEEKEYEYYEDYYYDYASACGVGELDVKVFKLAFKLKSGLAMYQKYLKMLVYDGPNPIKYLRLAKE